nr:ESX-5 secretion system ATPase EccB5 [Mycolicibacterium sp.]
MIRRLEHALIRADSRMIHDPMRGQMRSLLVGLVIAVLVCGAAGILAFFKPAPSLGDSQIVMSKSSGEMFIRIGDHLHPVLNIASARLIAGRSENPKPVDDKFLNALPLGAPVGIVGAPASLAAGADAGTSAWSVCDSTQTPAPTDVTATPTVETTVVAGTARLGDDIRAAEPAQMVLTRASGQTFLIYDGVRAPIDPTDPVLANALRLDGRRLRPMSIGLLNAFPLVDPIVPVTVDGAGSPTGYLPQQYRVGSIVRTDDSRGEQLYAVLRDGLQRISATVADIIRYGDPTSGPTAASTISPALISAAPAAHALRVDHYPSASPQLVAAEPDRVVCMSWQRTRSAAESTSKLLIGQRLPIPPGAQPVRLASADGNGPGLDGVYLQPGTGEYVQATGAAADSRSAGPLFYISDTGQRFHVRDPKTAAALGVHGYPATPDRRDDQPKPAPWPVLRLLPPGPELAQEAALIAHDTLGADPQGQKLVLPKS